jgi:Bacterial regulatory protein, Fis family
MSGESNGLSLAGLETLATALDGVKILEDREAFLKSLLSGALTTAHASRGYAILLDGDTVVAETSRTKDGERYKVDPESRKLAARTGVRLTSGTTPKRFAVEMNGIKVVVAAVIDGRLTTGLVLDRPDLTVDPGCAITVAFLLGGGALHRVAERPEIARAAHAAEAALAAGGVGAVMYLKTVDELERDAIELALRQSNWRKEDAAKKLGISRASIYMKVKKYNLQHPPGA